jgi:hypothetical protein
MQYYTVDGKGAYVLTGAGCMVHTESDDAEMDASARGVNASSHTFQSIWCVLLPVR